MTEARPVLRTSPSGPRKSVVGAIVQVGSDNPIETLTVADGTDAFFPRDSLGNPLQVTFPDFKDGNTLEIEYQLCGFFESQDPAPFTMKATPAVSVDGGATFYFAYPGNSQAVVQTSEDPFTLEGSCAVKIVDPMPLIVSGAPSTVPVTAPPIVRLFYTWPAADVAMGGGVEPIGAGGAFLKASEINADYVFQGPNGELATT